VKRVVWVMSIILAAFLTVREAGAQELQPALTNADIINLVKSGIGDQIIILKIQKSAQKFDTSPDALMQLKAAGVSDAVLNAMLTAPPSGMTESVIPPTQQDCSITLDKALGSIGSPEKLASIHSTSFIGTSVVSKASGTSTLQIERETIQPGSTRVTLRAANGTSAVAVLTPEFNYLVSGKMTTAIPPATLQDLEYGLKLDPAYMSQHRNEYSCIQDGTEQIGNISAARLRIKNGILEAEINTDPATGRPLRVTYQSSASGQSVTDLSDWRPVDEIQVPFRRHVVTRDAMTDLTITEYHVNPVLESSLFQPPVGQVAGSVTLKVLQSESVPYTVETNGGISTSCSISGSTSTSITASTYGNTTYGNATSTPDLRMNCRSSDTTIRWTHVLNAMFVQASDGNSYIIACDRAWAWSKCTPLRAGDTFLAVRGDKGFVVQSYNRKSKEQEATYRVLQSRAHQ